MGASSSTSLSTRVSEHEASARVGILFDQAYFRSIAGEDGRVPRKIIQQVCEERGWNESGSVFWQNLTQLMRCRNEIQRIADGILTDGLISAVPWLGQRGVMGEPSFQQQSLDGRAVSSVDDMFTVAAAAAPVFERLVRSAAPSCATFEADIKSRSRVLEKARNESSALPPPAISWVFDVVRGSCVFSSEREIVEFYTSLSEHPSVEIVRVKNRFVPPEFNGYRDILLNLRVAVKPDVWHMVELQIHHVRIKSSDVVYRSHAVYSFFRAFFHGNTDAVKKRLHLLDKLPGGVEAASSAEELVDSVLAPGTFAFSAASLVPLAELLQAMSMLNCAEKVRLRVVSLHRLQGEGSEALASALLELGALLRSQRELDRAEPLYLEATRVLEACFGKSHPKVADSLMRLALVERRQGKQSDARAHVAAAISILKATSGECDLPYANALHLHATLLMDLGRAEQSLGIHRECLVLQQRHDPCSAEVAASLNDIAAIHRSKGELDKAVPLFRQALDIKERLFGDDHPRVATGLNNLAGALQDQGKLDEAEPLMRRALAVWRQVYGPKHPMVVAGMNNLASLRCEQGRFEEAELLYAEILGELASSHRNVEHPHYAVTVSKLCELVERRRRARGDGGV